MWKRKQRAAPTVFPFRQKDTELEKSAEDGVVGIPHNANELQGRI